MFDVCAFDFPAQHQFYEKVKKLELSEAEQFFDKLYGKYFKEATNGY